MVIQTKTMVFALAACGCAVMLVVGVPRLQREKAPAAKRAKPAASEVQTSTTATVAPIVATVAPLAVTVQPIRVGDEPLKPIPSVEEFFDDYLEIDMVPTKIELGRRLFHDVRLSHDDTISCASCHDLRFGGVDRARTAIGVEGQVGPINTPTVFNAALNAQQFWDGRAPDLEAQADGPPNAAGEMASNWTEISSKLLQDAEIVALLREAYSLEGDLPKPIDKDLWLEAISDFERTLITPGAPFDAYLQGDEAAVSQMAKEGYQIFTDIGCIECHNGMAVGGASFQKMGRKNPYFGAHAGGVDLGRYNVTKKDDDRHVFKVPTLRNVAVTGPWFHDGSQKELEDAVRTMARVQLDYSISDAEVERLVAFLETLTGSSDGRSVNVAGISR